MEDDKKTLSDFLPSLALPDDKDIGFGGTVFRDPLPIEKPVERPSFFETAKSAFLEYNTAFSFVNLLANADNPYESLTIEEGYDPFVLAEQVRDEDKARIIQTNSSQEGQVVLKRILDEYERQDVLQRSGGWATAITTLGATFTDPASWIPLGQTIKAATLTKSAVKSAISAAKYTIPTAALSNAVIELNKETGSLSNWMKHTAFESAVGTSIGGALGAYAGQGLQKTVKDIKGVYSAIDKDVGVAVEIGKDGLPTGKLKAYPMPDAGKSAGAMKSAVAEVDASLKDINILEKNPYTQKIIGLGAPIMQGLGSSYKTVRNFYDALFPHNFWVAGGDLGNVGSASAYSARRSIMAIYEGLNLMQTQEWLLSQGKSKGSIKRGLEKVGETLGVLEKPAISKLENAELVAKSFRRGGDLGIPEVDKMAKAWDDTLVTKVMTLFKETHPDFKEHELTNISKYLTRIHNKTKIQENPQGFMNDLLRQYKKANDQIRELTQPLMDIKGRRTELKSSLEEVKARLKGTAKESAGYKALTQAKKKLEADRKALLNDYRSIDKDIQRRIAEGEISPELLYNAPELNQAQIDLIEKLNAPMVKLDQEIKALKQQLSAKGTVKAFSSDAMKAVDKALSDLTQLAPAKLEPKIIKTKTKELKSAVSSLKKEITDKQAKQALDDLLKMTKAQDLERLDMQAFLLKAKDVQGTLRGLKSASVKEFTAQKATIREQLKKLRMGRDAEKRKLQSIIEEPGFDKGLLRMRQDAQGFDIPSLRKPSRTELRRVLTDEELNKVAKTTLDRVTQMDDEQLMGAMFSDIRGEGTSIFGTRSLLINDEFLEPWLVNDMSAIMGVWTDQMSRRIALGELFGRFGIDIKEGMDGFVRMLKSEFDTKQAELIAKGASPKEFKALTKDFEKNKKLITDGYKTFMGNYADKSSTAYQVANGLKQIASASLLGNVPILAITDFFSPLFRFTFKEYFFDGIKTLIGSDYKALLKSGQVTKEAFQDIGVGVEVATGKAMQALSGYGTQYLPQNALQRYIQNAVKLSHNFSLSNYIEDIQQTLVGFTSQAKTLRVCEKVAKGIELTAEEVNRLDILKLPLNKVIEIRGDKSITLAEMILEQVQKHGQQLDNGGWVSNWHLWDTEAFKARLAFGESINKETRMTISKPNPADMPFGMQNPALGLVTQFMGWSFGATQNLAVPLITQFDSKKLIGALTMMASGALIDPLRQLAKGEEVKLDFDRLATSALVNSGFLTYYMDIFQRMNTALDIPFLRPFQGDRFRRKDFWSALGGPSAGVMNDFVTVFSALANGDLTQSDAHRIMRYTFPMFYNWMFRQPINAMIEATGLPEKRSKRD